MAGRPPAECGTESAFQRHKRRGEEIDPACESAHELTLAKRRAEHQGQKAERTRRTFEVMLDAAAETKAVDSTRLEYLEESRDMLRVAIRGGTASDPTKVAPLVKELRAVLAEIDSLENGGDAAVDPFEQFFGEGSNVARFPAPQDREAS